MCGAKPKTPIFAASKPLNRVILMSKTNDQLYLLITSVAGGVNYGTTQYAMLEALVEHYAATLEAQHGIPAADTLAAIHARAKELEPAHDQAVNETMQEWARLGNEYRLAKAAQTQP